MLNTHDFRGSGFRNLDTSIYNSERALANGAQGNKLLGITTACKKLLAGPSIVVGGEEGSCLSEDRFTIRAPRTFFGRVIDFVFGQQRMRHDESIFALQEFRKVLEQRFAPENGNIGHVVAQVLNLDNAEWRLAHHRPLTERTIRNAFKLARALQDNQIICGNAEAYLGRLKSQHAAVFTDAEDVSDAIIASTSSSELRLFSASEHPDTSTLCMLPPMTPEERNKLSPVALEAYTKAYRDIYPRVLAIAQENVQQGLIPNDDLEAKAAQITCNFAYYAVDAFQKAYQLMHGQSFPSDNDTARKERSKHFAEKASEAITAYLISALRVSPDHRQIDVLVNIVTQQIILTYTAYYEWREEAHLSVAAVQGGAAIPVAQRTPEQLHSEARELSEAFQQIVLSTVSNNTSLTPERLWRVLLQENIVNAYKSQREQRHLNHTDALGAARIAVQQQIALALREPAPVEQPGH